MPREKTETKRARGIEACRRMEALYPDAKPSLDFSTPFQCVIAVSLSAQTTDAAVNKVTPALFSRWPDPPTLAAASVEEVAETIRTIGFYRNKAKNAVACAQMLVADFGGEVPRTIDELQRLPGVGRKTANIVACECFGVVEGIAVDTHVNRIAHKLALVPRTARDPAKVEQRLLALLPRELWGQVNSRWILFGRQYCDARRPRCDACPLVDICPSAPRGV